MVNLQPITYDNFEDVIDLKVGNDQGYVPDNVYSIAQSKVVPSLIPLAIYNDQTLVGFILYGLYPNDYWIVRLMIDKKYQKKGYGTKAMEIIIKKIKEDKEHHKMYIDVHPENSVAMNLYKKFGFESTGKIENGEEILVLKY